MRRYFAFGKNNNKSVGIETNLLKRFYFAIGVEVGGDGIVGGTQVFCWHLAIPYLFQVFIWLDWSYLKRWPDECRNTEFYVNSELIHLEIWREFGGWSRGDWYWSSLWADKLKDVLMGKNIHTKTTISTHSVVIPMPEDGYNATIKIEHHTWTRPRRFWRRTIECDYAEVDCPKGIPFPGKGTTSSNCGDDALYSAAFLECTVGDAITKFYDVVMDYRQQYPL